MENFIRVWKNKVPEELCKRAIQTFEQIIADPEHKDSVIDNAKQFSDSNIGRKDLAIFLGDARYKQSDLCNEMMEYLHSSLLEYIEEFGQLKALTLSNRYSL